MSEAVKRYLDSIYHDPTKSASYSTLDVLYKYVKNIIPN